MKTNNKKYSLIEIEQAINDFIGTAESDSEFNGLCNFRDQLETLLNNQNNQNELYLNMQYYMEYCQSNGYVTPQDWIEKHKHF